MVLTCATAFRRLATGCLAEIAANQHAAALGQVDAVHRMRVGITRLRAAVSFFAPMTADKVWPELKDELRWLNRALGSARDVDVVVENLRHRRYRKLTLEGIDQDLERRSKQDPHAFEHGAALRAVPALPRLCSRSGLIAVPGASAPTPAPSRCRTSRSAPMARIGSRSGRRS